MEIRRFFTVLNGMLESGDFREEIFEEVLEELGIPMVYLAILDEAKVENDEPLDVDMQLMYIESIRKGVLEPKMLKEELMDSLIQVLQYRYEFYRRSKEINEEILANYRWCFEKDYLERYFDSYQDEIETLPFDFDPTLPVEYNLDRLEEFKKNAEEVIKHYYSKEELDGSLIPKSLVQVGITLTSLKKKENAPSVFARWKRFLRVFDSLDGKLGKSEAQDKAILLKVGNTIVQEYDNDDGKRLWKHYSTSDLRKAVKADYKDALQLIKSAELGQFPNVDLIDNISNASFIP